MKIVDDPYRLRNLRTEIDPWSCPWCERSLSHFVYLCDKDCHKRNIENREQMEREEVSRKYGWFTND